MIPMLHLFVLQGAQQTQWYAAATLATMATAFRVLSVDYVVLILFRLWAVLLAVYLTTLCVVAMQVITEMVFPAGLANCAQLMH